MKSRALIGPTQLASGQLDNTAGRITFWSFTETTGTANAKVRLWDGTGTGLSLVVSITLTANQSTRDYPSLHGLPYQGGLYLELVSGAVEGQVYSIPEPDWDEGLPVVVIGNLTL